ncbi:hypothetical protein GPUN_1026 [Glaciecola punicea ACAM 611]|jgi:biotin-dependent carboxylase-like uncharacterized protein|uniref:Carboxyltransferase domain-containing protein n=1 Tax=Glaciecola punicea ACAM 611 TaxID=1121923 RepID=H5TA30_9ALTE|nr:biotin-dependent carboxyltransferase family protein [Glaciecola punicea]GAB55157.1 hypothetical protein GPUN_1026 [Glaciecola punicea ACAM 611]
MLTIIKSGLTTQWTDSGRKGRQLSGYSQSGAIDWFSFQLANALCGNALHSPALEVMAGNIEFSVSIACAVAITGAHTDISINKQNIKNGKVFLLKKNDHVKLGPATKGLFTYIAFSAAFELPVFANSVCAVKREKTGGMQGDGKPIIDGEEFVLINAAQIDDKATRYFGKGGAQTSFTPLIKAFIASQFYTQKKLPFSFCYQQAAFSKVDKQRFIAHEFEITQYIDKMGVRLAGPPIHCELTNLISQPMANGAIQIPGSGLPIIMRNDRQTIGGYPVIGTVNSQGLALLAQATSSQKITFVATDFDTANIWRQLIDLQLKQVLNTTKLRLYA